MTLHSKKLFINKRKRILKKILVALSLFACGALTVYAVLALSESFFPFPWFSHPLFAVSVVTLVTVIAYKPLDALFAEIFKRYWFKKRSYVHLMLMNLAEELELVLDLQELSNMVVNTFGELLHLKTVALLVSEGDLGGFQIAAASGWSVSDYRRVRVPKDAALIHAIQDAGAHALVRNRVVRTVDWRDANELSHDFDRVRAGWVIPFWVDHELLGFLAFSAFQSERVFDETDFQLFRKFTNSVARRIHNSISFMKLRKANEELQDTQSKLVQVTKLAAIEQLATGLAHQIHNPLTIISGKAQVLLLRRHTLIATRMNE